MGQLRYVVEYDDQGTSNNVPCVSTLNCTCTPATVSVTRCRNLGNSAGSRGWALVIALVLYSMTSV